MHTPLFNLITQKVPLTEADKALCRQYFEPARFPRHAILEEEQKVPTYLYYIVSGYLRLFHYDAKGNEVTTHINCPPGFITAYAPFAEQTRSSENVECITDCELLKITKPNLDLLMAQSPALKDFSIWVFQQSIQYNEARSRELATLTAEERYSKLMANYPQLLHHVPLQYIASFLGMNAKSLSRIRRQIIR